MAVNFNVFRAFMKHRVGSNIEGTIVVTVKGNWSDFKSLKCFEGWHQPCNVTTCVCHYTIFSHSRRTRHDMLFFTFSRDRRTMKSNTETSEGLASIFTRTPVSITVCLKDKLRRRRQVYSLTTSMFNISNKLEICLPMRNTWLVHELWEYMSRISQIRACYCKIDQALKVCNNKIHHEIWEKPYQRITCDFVPWGEE